MKWLVALCLLVLTFLFFGCGRNGSNGENKNSISGVDYYSESELRQSLDKFEEFFASTITDAADEIDRLSGDSRPRRSTLKLRSAAIKASGAMLRQQDPLTAFVDIWVLSARLSRYFQAGNGSRSFAPNQHVVIEAVKKTESRIESIAQEYLDKENFEKTRQKVHEFAKTNPIKPDLKEIILYASQAYQGRPNPFEEIITLPLLPLTMVNGVTETVTGAGKMAKSADHIADTVEAFPESARWQLLMLLYDIEKLDTVKTTVKSFEGFSKSASRLAASADQLPEKLRLEIVELLKQIEETSPNIRKTLQSASNTTGNIKEALKTGGELTRSINLTSEKIQLTAAAWQSAARATDAAISRMIEFRGPDEEEFDIAAYKETARQFNDLAGKIPEIFQQADKFTKKLTRRIAFLIVIFFTMTIALTLTIIRKQKPKQKPEAQAQG
ncbi:MAG: hypothetical protein FVQ82_10540 [Planctomycetes bacterium]|nr:hypothetical protein [Planctomycetota bacterium]